MGDFIGYVAIGDSKYGLCGDSGGGGGWGLLHPAHELRLSNAMHSECVWFTRHEDTAVMATTLDKHKVMKGKEKWRRDYSCTDRARLDT